MSWTVLHTRPNCEKKVAEYCKTYTISHYLPLRTVKRTYQRRKVTITRPLFPGYVFTNLTEQQRINLLKTNNVLRIITSRDNRKLKRELVYVRQALRASPYLTAAPMLKKGMKVYITSGPFSGIQGMVSIIRSKTRVRINVEMIGQSVIVEAKNSDLEVENPNSGKPK